jgi:hypothetical protein
MSQFLHSYSNPKKKKKDQIDMPIVSTETNMPKKTKDADKYKSVFNGE